MLSMNGPFTNFFARGLVMQLFRACFYPQVELLWGLMVWFIWNAQAEKEMFEKEDQKTAEQPVWSILTLKIPSLTYSISFFFDSLVLPLANVQFCCPSESEHARCHCVRSFNSCLSVLFCVPCITHRISFGNCFLPSGWYHHYHSLPFA
jgi:hypothetical protein